MNYGDGGYWFTQPVNNGYGALELAYSGLGSVSQAGTYRSGPHNYEYFKGTACGDLNDLKQKQRDLVKRRKYAKEKIALYENKLANTRSKSKKKTFTTQIQGYKNMLKMVGKAIRKQRAAIRKINNLCKSAKATKSGFTPAASAVTSVAPNKPWETALISTSVIEDDYDYEDEDDYDYEDEDDYEDDYEDDLPSGNGVAAETMELEQAAGEPSGIEDWYAENKKIVLLGAAGVGGYLLIRLMMK